MNGIAGLDRLIRALGTLRNRAAKKIAKAGANAGISVLANAMVSAINASGASGPMKAAARKTIGKRLRKKEGQASVGKAGFAVGKRGKRKLESAHARYMRGQGGAHETRGVGMSATDIHWPVLGTGERVTESGHPTGRMESELAGLIAGAADSAATAMLEAARKKCEEVLASEAEKARK